MQYFNFARLIKKYSTDFVAKIPSERYLDDAGDWQEAKPTDEMLRGAIISHRESKIFRSEGTLTGQDRALYMLYPLKNDLHGAKIVHENKVYSVGDLLTNGKFTGIWAYTLKYVSAFKETAPEFDITDELDDLEDRLDGVLEKETVPTPETGLFDIADALKKRMDGVLND